MTAAALLTYGHIRCECTVLADSTHTYARVVMAAVLVTHASTLDHAPIPPLLKYRYKPPLIYGYKSTNVDSSVGVCAHVHTLCGLLLSVLVCIQVWVSVPTCIHYTVYFCLCSDYLLPEPTGIYCYSGIY